MTTKRRDKKGRILRDGEVQRPDGRYMFRYNDAAGDRQTLYSWKLVDTDKVPSGRQDCEALRDMERRVLRDRDDMIRGVDAKNTTVNDLFDEFIDARIDLKESTRCNYIGLYDKHVRASFGIRTINAVKYSDIQKLYIKLINENGLAPSSLMTIHSILYQIFDTAVMDRMIRVNPSANVVKSLRRLIDTEKESRHALTVAEQEELINYVYNTKAYEKFATLFTVLLGTGMRIGEALGLRWSDCDFDNELISVNHTMLYKPSRNPGYAYRISEPKTKAGIRIIPMFSEVKEALLKEKNKRRPKGKKFSVDGYSDFIFLNSSGKVYTPSSIYDTIQNITYDHNKTELLLAMEENREPCYLPKFSAHILRHTFCTRLCKNETNIKVIQDVMGHRNIRTTMEVYSEATKEKKKASFKGLEGKIKLS